MSKIKIDPDKCIGCGLCASIADKSFRMNDEKMKAEVIDPAGDEKSKIQEAIDSCPVQAISWIEPSFP